MSEYEALLGLGVTDDEKMRMLAEQLRQREQGGNMLSLSTIPQAAALGKTMQKQAPARATSIASQRESALNRARQAEQDKQNLRFKNLAEQRAAESHAMNMAKPTNFGTYTNETDNSPRTGGMVYNPETGQYEWQFDPNLDQQTPYNRPYSSRSGGGSGGGSYAPKRWRDELSGRTFFIDNGRVLDPTKVDGQGYMQPVTDPETIDRVLNEARDEYIADRGRLEGTKKAAGKEAEFVSDVRIKNYDAADRHRKNIGTLGQMREALNAGAWTGSIPSMFPDLTDAAQLFSSAKEQLTLDTLGDYDLKPFSDTDLGVLRQAAVPNLHPTNMAHWIDIASNVQQVLADSKQYLSDWIREHNRVPNAEDRKEINKYIQENFVKGYDLKFELDKVKNSKSEKKSQAGWSIGTPE